ncbi:hypothetical protein HBO07_12565 [Pseudomonas proteolytica]|nr:hypothetical protein [Pseudomonas proteolytica]
MPAKNWRAARAPGPPRYRWRFSPASRRLQELRQNPGKKRATEVAQNALRAHVTRKNLWFFTLIRVFPDKKTKPYKKQHHEADSQHPGENHIIEKHDRPPALALLRWG